MRPLEGGFSGETFLAEAAGERTVVRVYGGRGATRGPQAPEVDAAVLRLVRGLLPVAEVLEVRRADPGSGAPGLLVTSLLPGERLDVVLPDAGRELRARIGRSVGELLARLAQMPMPRAGQFADGDLRIEPMPPEVADLPTWVEHCLTRPGLADWPERHADGLRALAEDAQALLDTVTRTCLVHSDLNGKNLLVDPDTGEVTGLVDWEFAHAGLPVSDLGNLLRFPHDGGDPVLAGAALAAYAGRVPDAGDPADLLARARAADLYALVDLAARRGENPVAGRAHGLLRQIVRDGDPRPLPATGAEAVS